MWEDWNELSIRNLSNKNISQRGSFSIIHPFLSSWMQKRSHIRETNGYWVHLVLVQLIRELRKHLSDNSLK